MQGLWQEVPDQQQQEQAQENYVWQALQQEELFQLLKVGLGPQGEDHHQGDHPQGEGQPHSSHF